MFSREMADLKDNIFLGLTVCKQRTMEMKKDMVAAFLVGTNAQVLNTKPSQGIILGSFIDDATLTFIPCARIAYLLR